MNCETIREFCSQAKEFLTEEPIVRAAVVSLVALAVVGLIQHGFKHQALGDVYSLKNAALNWTLVGLSAVWGYALRSCKSNGWEHKKRTGLIATYIIAMALIVWGSNNWDINLYNYFKDSDTALYIYSALTASFASYHLAAFRAKKENIVDYKIDNKRITQADILVGHTRGERPSETAPDSDIGNAVQYYYD